MATHSSILAWKIPWTEEPTWWATIHGVTMSQAQLNVCAHDISICSLSNFSMRQE